jgi:dolichol-phosphate mannosyltransferase
MRRFALPEMPVKGADFLLMDRKVIDAYNAIPEKNTSFLAMILWLGFRQTSIEYVKQERHSGRSKWSLSRKFKVFIDSFISFSYAPIRLMSLAGAAIGLLGFLYALVVVFNAIRGFPIEGWSSLMVVVLMLGGFQLLMLGVLGEYLWRAFDEARGRPRYVIEEYRRLAGQGAPAALNGDARATRPALAAPAGPNPEAVRRETAPLVKTQSVGETA